MTIALVADVHGNSEALDAVLADIDKVAPDARFVCAGDVVGYGPDPEECIARLVERRAAFVRGNHEEMVLGLRDDSRCIAAGVIAVHYTRMQLSADARALIATMPLVAEPSPGLLVCHGDLDDAGRYISDAGRADRVLDRVRTRTPATRVVVCGHTHVPMCFSLDGGNALAILAALGATREPRRVSLAGTRPWLVNPGGVGQGRDGTARAHYALLADDLTHVSFHSLAYDHAATARKMRDAGLLPSVVVDEPHGVRRRVEAIKTNAARALVRVRPLRAAWFRIAAGAVQRERSVSDLRRAR